MIKVLLLIFEPAGTWDGIVRAQRSLSYLLFVFLLPLLVLGGLAEGAGLIYWGEPQGEFGQLKKFPLGEAAVYEVAQVLLSILVVFVGAKLIKSLGETFHGRNSFTQAFATVAYGLGPLFALRALDAFPAVNPWIGWGIGILLSVGVLYQGLPRVMQPDPPHAFGLYVTSSFLLILTTGVARFVTAWYLEGRLTPVERIISDFVG
jgi:hypothetical protein